MWLRWDGYINSQHLFQTFSVPMMDARDVIQTVHSFVCIVKSYFLAQPLVFASQSSFASNVVHCTQAEDAFGLDLCDKFIHTSVDHRNEGQIAKAIHVSTERAFSSRFVPPITDILKGRAYGEMLVLSPT